MADELEYRFFTDDDRRREIEARLLALEREHYIATLAVDYAERAANPSALQEANARRHAAAVEATVLAEKADALPPPGPNYRAPVFRARERTDRRSATPSRTRPQSAPPT